MCLLGRFFRRGSGTYCNLDRRWLDAGDEVADADDLDYDTSVASHPDAGDFCPARKMQRVPQVVMTKKPQPRKKKRLTGDWED